MNVVRLVNFFPSFKKIQYGLGPTFYFLSEEQVKLGINVHVICKRYSYQKAFEKMGGIYVHRVATPYNISALHRLIKVKSRMKIDLVHAHATACPSYAIFKTLLDQGVGYVVHVHGTTKGVVAAYNKFLPDAFNGKTKERVQRWLSSLRQTIMWKRANALIAVSKSLVGELISLYNIAREKINVAHNGVDLQTFYPRKPHSKLSRMLRLEPNSHLILYLGGFRPVKGPIFLIKALERVYEKFRNVQVLFVGNPKHPLESYYVKPVMNLIRDLKISKAIRLVGNIPHYQLPEYYSAADALVVPSIYDSFPKTALEAMACGTPVIASAVGGLAELIQNEETGILVKPARPDELAEAITNIVSNADLRKELGLRARRLVEEKFTWTHTAKRIMSIYQEIVNESE